MPTGVIFDMDGVLVDSGAAHTQSWRIVARQHGLSVSDEEFKRTFGRPSRDIIRIIWGTDTSDARVAEIDDEKELRYRELIRANVPLMPGCREVLALLRDAGLILSVATSGPRENLECVIAEAGLGEFFRATVNGFDIEHGKPAPDCFLLAAERCGLTPRECVVVEDAPVGIQAAIAAGMPAVGLSGTHPAERLREVGAACVIEQLRELTPELIAKCPRV